MEALAPLCRKFPCCFSTHDQLRQGWVLLSAAATYRSCCQRPHFRAPGCRRPPPQQAAAGEPAPLLHVGCVGGEPGGGGSVVANAIGSILKCSVEALRLVGQEFAMFPSIASCSWTASCCYGKIEIG
ncbi:uncharacterized protein [Lolium perenne]|nr:uncharacterized protein LOC127345922 isoform X5 [Lolium perenne]XP_051228418.1 uncharacterized protein LOC127345924 isoform X5 [Lolium perenne]